MKKKLVDFDPNSFNYCARPSNVGLYIQTKLDEVLKQSTATPKQARWFSARYTGDSPTAAKGGVYAIYCAVKDNGNREGKLCAAPKPPFTVDDLPS